MSILESLNFDNKRIFDLEVDTCSVTLTEGCDCYFTATLDREELTLLIGELTAIRDNLKSG